MTWVILFILLWLSIRMIISLGTRTHEYYRQQPVYKHRHTGMYRAMDDRHGR